MLGAMGCVDDEAALSEQLEQEHRQHLAARAGSRDGGTQRRRRYFEVRLPIEFVNDALTWQLQQEQGAVLFGQLTPIEGESWSGWPSSRRWSARPIASLLDVQPALGYHQLILLEEGK